MPNDKETPEAVEIVEATRAIRVTTGDKGVAVDAAKAHRPGLRGSARTRQRLRTLHDQTWELELVISGALAFVLAFTPNLVDRVYYPLSAQLSGAPDFIAFLGFYYVKLILYTMILAFGFHIATRAFWVALVGLDSVFPRGVRWDRLNQGPFTRRIFRQALPSVRELIVTTDGIASVVFASASTLVAIFVMSVVGASVLGGVGFLIAAFLPFEVEQSKIAAGAALVLAAIITLPLLIDRVVGRFLAGSALGRVLEVAIRASAEFAMFRIYGPIQFTLASQLGRWRYGLGVFGVLTLVLSIFLINDGVLASGQVEFVPGPYDAVRAGGDGVDPRAYEDQENPDKEFHLSPTIPTDVFNDEMPYMRVFLPSDPQRDAEALSRACPEVTELAEPGLRRVRRRGVAPREDERLRNQQVLECAARFWSVTVDGEPVVETPVFFRHPETGLRGLAWYVDLRPLPNGRHLLEVARPDEFDEPDPDADSAADPSRPPWIYRIPFWN